MSGPGIVSAPTAVTADWLTAVLQHAGIDARIESFSAANVGTGQVGQNVRFNLNYAGTPPANAPSSIVGKFASDDPDFTRSVDADRNSIARDPVDGQYDVIANDQLLTFFATEYQHDFTSLNLSNEYLFLG